jgi:hypothetical protein
VTLRAAGVQVKDELEITVSTVELSEMIAESRSEGLLDPEEHMRLTRALRIRNRVVADVAVPLAEIHAVQVAPAGSGPTVGAIQRALAETGYSRFPVTERSGRLIGYLHIKDVSGSSITPTGHRPLRGAPPASGARHPTAARCAVPAAPQQQPPRPGEQRRWQRSRDGGAGRLGRGPGRHRPRWHAPCVASSLDRWLPPANPMWRWD